MRTAIEAEKYQFARKGKMLKLVRLRHSKTKRIHLFQKTLSERTANGSCRAQIAQSKGTVVPYLVCENNEFFLSNHDDDGNKNPTNVHI